MEWILAKIKAVRKFKGLSQEELADKIGIDQKTYGNWETGRTEMTLSNLERISKALDVDVRVFWDTGQFEDPNWKPHEDIKFEVKEPDAGLYQQLLDSKEQLIKQKDEYIEVLKEQLAKYKIEKPKRKKG